MPAFPATFADGAFLPLESMRQSTPAAPVLKRIVKKAIDAHGDGIALHVSRAMIEAIAKSEEIRLYFMAGQNATRVACGTLPLGVTVCPLSRVVSTRNFTASISSRTKPSMMSG